MAALKVYKNSKSKVFFAKIWPPIKGLFHAKYFNDHNPPHFHAKYSGYEALFTFDGGIIEGGLPGRATKIVREWLNQHQDELEQNWKNAREGKPLNYITPLE